MFRELDITYRSTTLFCVVLDDVRMCLVLRSDVFVVNMTCHM